MLGAPQHQGVQAGSTPEPSAPQERATSLAQQWRHADPALKLAFLGLVTISFNRTRLAGITVSDLLFAAAGAMIVLELLTDRTRGLATPAMRRTPPLLLVGTALLLTAGTLSTLASWDPFGSAQVMVRLAWLTLIWFWILRAVSRDRAAFHLLLTGLRITVLISATFGVLGELGIYSVGTFENVNANRQMAFFGHPNELGALLAIGLPLFVFDVPRPPAGGGRLLRRYGSMAFIVFAIGASGSIVSFSAVFVSLAAAGLLLLTMRTRRRMRRETPIVAMVTIAAVGFGFVAISDSDLPVVQRFTSIREGNDGTISSRADLNTAVIERLDNTLFLGTGPQIAGANSPSAVFDLQGSASVAGPDVVRGVHNVYLKLVHEAGVLALLGLGVLLIGTVNLLWRLAVNTRNTELLPVVAALLAGLVAANAFGSFNPMMYQRYFWVPVGLTMSQIGRAHV